MAGSPIAGTQARLTIGGTNLNMVKWSINAQANDIPTTNFESVGSDGYTYEEGITGIRKADVTFEGMWDLSSQLPDSGLVEGAIVSNVYLYIEKGVLRITFTSLRILSFKVDADVESNKPTWISISAKTNGMIIWP